MVQFFFDRWTLYTIHIIIYDNKQYLMYYAQKKVQKQLTTIITNQYNM